MSMTPRERWFALLENRRPDRIPTDYQATPEVTARLLRDLDCTDETALWRKLHVDKRKMVEPRWKRAHHPRDPQADLWGVRFRKADYGSGTYDEPCFHPLAKAQSVEEVHAHGWPDPDDFDYDVVTQAVEEDDRFWPIHGGCYEPFLLHGYLRGLATAFEDLLLRPEIAEAILGHLFEFHAEHHRRIFAAGRGRIDLTWVAEDLGAQTHPLMSLATYRRFLLPNQVKMAELARSFGVHVMYHTDGAARMFLPDLVDRVGIEILNPIQWRCPGMERESLVAEYGDRLIFHGSIDNQRTLAFGSVDDVVEEVRQSVTIYRSARWICAPCHNLQPITPTENIVALYETIHRLGSCQAASGPTAPVLTGSRAGRSATRP
jgi:uroporphyrinogen decarboxylase